jgi:threonine dehydrogenase-like Zn-dependent dehydrogenase
MQQLTYISRGRLEWRDVPDPVLQGETDALVRPLAAARCDGDKVFLFHDVTLALRAGLALHVVDVATQHLFGTRPFEGPFAIGHECVAEVVRTGGGVSRHHVGDVVVVPWAISCGSCQHCELSLTGKCLEAGSTYASAYGFGAAAGDWGGMVSDLVRVPNADHMLVPVPAGVDIAALASASDNIPDAWRSVAPALKQRPGAPVLVVGGSAASIGLYAAGIAVALGSEQVDYVDHDPERLAIAEALGARPIERPARKARAWYQARTPTRVGVYPISVDASAKQSGLRHALQNLAPGGICTSVGYFFKRGTSLPLMQMYGNCSTLHVGLSHARPVLPDVLALIESKKFQPEKVTTHLASWADAGRAFLTPGAKVVVTRPSLFQHGRAA